MAIAISYEQLLAARLGEESGATDNKYFFRVSYVRAKRP
jgi:hypothetical protein